MLDDEEIEFIKTEMEKKGIILESVMDTLNDDSESILDLCNEIIGYEGVRCGGRRLGDNGEIVRYPTKDDYNIERLYMAEDILLKLHRHKSA